MPCKYKKIIPFKDKMRTVSIAAPVAETQHQTRSPLVNAQVYKAHIFPLGEPKPLNVKEHTVKIKNSTNTLDKPAFLPMRSSSQCFSRGLIGNIDTIIVHRNHQSSHLINFFFRLLTVVHRHHLHCLCLH